MTLRPVTYDGDIKTVVDNYNALAMDEKTGKYWDNIELYNIKKHIKDHYLKVQDYTCVYCQQKIIVRHGMAWDTEHIIPKSLYPQFLFTEENLSVACKDCNLIKLDKNILLNPKRKTFPKNSEDYLIVHPHFDEYFEHIKVISDNQIYLPIDDKGKNTIEVCGLLRFAYQYTEYGKNDTSIKIEKRIVKLADELINASTPFETGFIIDCLKDLKDEYNKTIRDEYLKDL